MASASMHPFYRLVESFLRIRHSLLAHSPLSEYLGCFQSEALTNKASMLIHIQTLKP